jgi:S-adenosylmethionine hydrolase
MRQVEHLDENRMRGEVVKVDKFGNLITNIGEIDAPELFQNDEPAVSILIAGLTITRLCKSYAEGGDAEVFAIVGSSGYLEIAARQTSAAEKLGASVGTPVGLVQERR